MKNWRELQEESVLELKRVKALTPNQGKYIKAIETSLVTLVTGAAGAGKSYIACGIAAQMLRENRVERVILTRPLVTCGSGGKGFGFLPGDKDEKITPYMTPLLEAFGEFFGKSDLTKLFHEKKIEMVPLDLMRGMSIKKSIIICDEAQNAEYSQLRMLLTRIDHGTRLVITGDTGQTDLNHFGRNPLQEVINRLKPGCHPCISFVQLTAEDVQRPKIVAWIDERLTSQGGRKSEGDGWFSFNCPACLKKVFYYGDDSWQVECHACKTPLDLWIEDFSPAKAQEVSDECVGTQPYKQEAVAS